MTEGAEHKCDQLPSEYVIEWSTIYDGGWYLDDKCEIFVKLSFCPFCGVKLERP